MDTEDTLMLIELRNDFHGSAARVRVPSLPYTLSARQTARVERALCGLSDCCCGTGPRAPGRAD